MPRMKASLNGMRPTARTLERCLPRPASAARYERTNSELKAAGHQTNSVPHSVFADEVATPDQISSSTPLAGSH